MQTPLFEDRPLFDAAAIEANRIFLSRLVLNSHNRNVRRDAGDCHALHRTMMNAFPQAADGERAREKFGVLHRLDFEPRTGKITLLVQSGVEPDWSNLPENYLSEQAEANLACRRVDEQFGSIERGAELIFRLRANPAKRIGKNDKIAAPKFRDLKNRRRVEIYGEENQIEWLRRKAESAGFQLTSAGVNSSIANAVAQPNGKIYGKRLSAVAENSTAAKRETLTFGAVTFEGSLIVTDATEFLKTLKNGIGQGKAYGFGLLSVARAVGL